MKTKTIFKSLLVAAGLLVGSSAWAGDKTVVKYSFDDAESPSLTAGSRISFDYGKTSVITSTKFLNAYNNTNGDPGSSAVSLGSTDLSGENWTLSFEWAAVGGCNSKADHTTLKAGDTNLFDLTGNSNWNTTVTITYAGSDGTKTLPVPGCDKGKRFSAATGDQLNTTAYWHHIVVTGSASGVKMTITNSSTGTAVVEDIVLSETNVNPTQLNIEPCCGGAIGIDELLLSYAVEGEVIQTPIAAITAVNGIERTVTATCDTEGAVISYSLDEGANYTDGASVTVDADCTIWFKATKGGSESDILEFPVEAGTEIKLHAPTINRTSNTSVTITANQTDLLLSPTATIYYSYNGDEGNFTGSKVLEVTADAVITAYATATGYTQSDESTRAVALWPTAIETIENTPARTSGWSGDPTFADTYKEISGRKYAALMLEGTQWGNNIYLQEDGKWGLRASGNWYINDNSTESWMLFPAMKAGDIIVVDVTYPASNTVNATYSKYTYGSRQTYEVTADGDVELAFKKIDATTMDYLYGVYAYREVTSVPATIGSYAIATFSSEYDVDFSAENGVTVYTAKVNDAQTAVVLTAVESKKVPANTGVILKGDAGAYTGAVIASAPALENNQLAVSDGTSNVQGSYVLTTSDDKVVFGVWDSETPLSKGRVYLPADVVDFESGAKTLNIIFEGETTGINDASRLNNAEMTSEKVVFNLNGQRIAAPQKGINIINGRKYIVK